MARYLSLSSSYLFFWYGFLDSAVLPRIFGRISEKKGSRLD